MAGHDHLNDYCVDLGGGGKTMLCYGRNSGGLWGYPKSWYAHGARVFEVGHRGEVLTWVVEPSGQLVAPWHSLAVPWWVCKVFHPTDWLVRAHAAPPWVHAGIAAVVVALCAALLLAVTLLFRRWRTRSKPRSLIE